MDAEIREAFKELRQTFENRDGEIFSLLRKQAETQNACALACVRSTAKMEGDLNGLGERVNNHIADCTQARDRWWTVKLAGLGTVFVALYEGAKYLFSKGHP